MSYVPQTGLSDVPTSAKCLICRAGNPASSRVRGTEVPIRFQVAEMDVLGSRSRTRAKCSVTGFQVRKPLVGERRGDNPPRQDRHYVVKVYQHGPAPFVSQNVFM
jgi:hypothetical protein